MRRLSASIVGGAAVGAAAAAVYKLANVPLLPQFMSDPGTTAVAATREAKARQIDQMLRAAAPAIEVTRRQAEVTCGALDGACRRKRQEHREAMTQLRSSLRDAAAKVNYDGAATADERDAYVHKYGCVAWTPTALDAIAELRQPIVEVGAGDGQWAKALRAHARLVDVVAFDDGTELPSRFGVDEARSGSRSSSSSGGGSSSSSARHRQPVVTLGVDGRAAAARHPDRALLLVAPPPGRAAAGWLAAYKGNTVVFVGEGRGGANADEEFFATLERFFTLVRTAPLDPFPGGCEKLWILQRKQSLKDVPAPVPASGAAAPGLPGGS